MEPTKESSEELRASYERVLQENAMLLHQINRMQLGMQGVADKCKQVVDYIDYVNKTHRDTEVNFNRTREPFESLGCE